MSDLKAIVEWLEGNNEDQWRDQMDLAEEAFSDATRMASPKRLLDKEDWGKMSPGDPKMQQALPHIREMVSAMRQRNRGGALASGRAAVAVFDQ